MKIMVRSSLITTLFLSFAIAASAQEMTKDQWEQSITDAMQKRDMLKKEVESLEADVVKLKTESAMLTQQVDKCQKDLMAMLGTTQAREKEFSEYLDRIDAQMNGLSKLSNQDLLMRRAELDTVQSMINKAKARKLALLPENEQRIHEQQFRLDIMRESLKKNVAQNEAFYTVGTWAKNHDCLWNIAKKPKVYDNAFLWPKIWQDNRDQIKNPDVIRPGEKLRIPPKSLLTTTDNDALKSYWHQKESYASTKHAPSEAR